MAHGAVLIKGELTYIHVMRHRCGTLSRCPVGGLVLRIERRSSDCYGCTKRDAPDCAIGYSHCRLLGFALILIVWYCDARSSEKLTVPVDDFGSIFARSQSRTYLQITERAGSVINVE